MTRRIRKTPPPPKSELLKLYITENKSQSFIAKHYNSTPKIVRRWLKELGIVKERELISEAISGGLSGRKSSQSSEDFRRYQELSTVVRRTNTDEKLILLGITRDSLHEDYIVNNYSISKMAGKYEISKSQVRKYLKRFNIEAKPLEQQLSAKEKYQREFYSDEVKVRDAVKKTQETIKTRYGSNWYKNSVSKPEGELLEFVLEVLNKTVGVSAVLADGSVHSGDYIEVYSGCYGMIVNPDTGGGLQLDIYIPSLSFAIEFNGEYYHGRGEYFRDLENNTINSREYLKTILCGEVGITLLHVWEGDYKNNCEEIYYSIEGLLLEALQLL